MLAGLVGGWRSDFPTALKFARAHGLAMAERHLRDGQDVIIPQLVTSYDRADSEFEETARTSGATYIEVALLVDDHEHDQRLRDMTPANEVEARIQTFLEDPGSDLVSRVRRHMTEYLSSRPATIRIDTTGLGPDAMYSRLLTALAAT